MKKVISRHCPACQKYGQIEWLDQKEFFCPGCNTKWGEVQNQADFFDRCPMCPCRQFYLSKNFNQMAGCLIMLCGIVAVPWTYGLSLPFFALVDWLLFKKVPYVINCYRCGCEFSGFEADMGRFKPFLHHIGLKYDKFR
ncbi:MAG: hypothetical protein KBD53_00215 [Candidatus Omnitrophica bacterium]|nr:hypothetical protein [Candidatus Omnitrophota bacterium]